MRKDIIEAITFMKKDGIKSNYVELDRIYNCDYRVIKRYFENDVKERKKVVRENIRNQELEDMKEDQISKKEYNDPFKGEKIKATSYSDCR